MSIILETNPKQNIYEEKLNKETIIDFSSQNLQCFPEITNKLLCVLYLQNNKISTLPDDIFPSLPSLMWLDLRDNRLSEIPRTIKNHPSLTHLLLQNNKLTSLPHELGTVNLKVLQLNGNPLTYPPREVISSGTKDVLSFLYGKFIDDLLVADHSQLDTSTAASVNDNYADLSQGVSYNSVIDGDKMEKGKTLSVQFSEKDLEDSDEEVYAKNKGKCPKLAKSRHQLSPYSQSSKYVSPPVADSRAIQNLKIRQNYFKELTIKKHRDLLDTQEKILQGRKNLELLKNWRKTYKFKQQFANKTFKLHSKSFPYDTSTDYMTLMTREDIEKDLPDKYRKRLVRRSKPTVPRKTNNDVHLAIKIKQLFDNLEAIDQNREQMTPRTEQRMLLSEIQKITAIKQKLSELSLTNGRSVAVD